MLDIYAFCPKSYENQSRPGVLNLGVGGGFHEPLEIVYKLLYTNCSTREGVHGFTQESCDLKILTDPQRLLVALKDVASEGLTWSTF